MSAKVKMSEEEAIRRGIIKPPPETAPQMPPGWPNVQPPTKQRSRSFLANSDVTLRGFLIGIGWWLLGFWCGQLFCGR